MTEQDKLETWQLYMGGINPNERHFMIDIETNGVDPCKNAITSIAIVEFSIVADDPFVNKLREPIAIAARFEAWREKVNNANPQTMKWREDNGVDEEEAKHQKVLTPRELATWVTTLQFDYNCDTYFWAFSPSFDIAFINKQIDAYDTAIYYRSQMDLRTIVNLATMGPGAMQPHDLFDKAAQAIKNQPYYVEQYPLLKHYMDRDGNLAPHNCFVDAVTQICILRSLMLNGSYWSKARS